MLKSMSLSSRRQLVHSIRQRYTSAGRTEKGRILDEFVAATGYHRKYAIAILDACASEGEPAKGRSRERRRIYGEEVKQPLMIIWQAANHVCSKRLEPFIPEFLSRLEHFGHLSVSDETKRKLISMSTSTMDRLLADVRRARGRGVSTTRPGALIKQQIPVHTFADWNDVKPGFFEGDTVSHCGTSAHGSFLSTLVLTDIATTWTECLALLSHDQQQVGDALRQARRLLPFPLLGLDTDNGSEFINYQLLKYCNEENITFTRCRPYKKNDQCHVEQKNGALVRRIVGYDRFEGLAARDQLAALYGVFRLYLNFFQPSLKLISKERRGSKVIKKYATAHTPYQRVLDSPDVAEEIKLELQRQYQQLDPVALLRQLERYQDSLWQYAWRPPDWRGAEPSTAPIGLPASAPETEMSEQRSQRESADRRPHREKRDYRRSGNGSKHHLVKHTWRTRSDPFVLVYEEIKQRLDAEPGLCAKTLLLSLQEQYPGQFNSGHLRTLQRRVRQCRERTGMPCGAVIVPTSLVSPVIGQRVDPAIEIIC